jgi:hypothetical protein
MVIIGPFPSHWHTCCDTQTKGDKIAREIKARAGEKSSGACARVCREAIEAALAITLRRTEHAKDYGPSLTSAGFVVVASSPENGDTAIYPAIPDHPSGHMQIYADGGWYSDFRQRDQYPGPKYRAAGTAYTLYRYK